MNELWAGINTDEREIDIKDSESPDSRNEDISIEGKEKTRAGMSKVQSSVADSMIVGLFNLKSDDCITNHNLMVTGSGSPGGSGELVTLPFNIKTFVTINTIVRDDNPNGNYSGYIMGEAYDSGFGSNYKARMYIMQPSNNLNYLSLFIYGKSGIGDLFIYNAGVWVENTLTWNNQPALGPLIKTVANGNITAGVLNKIDLGTGLTNGVVLKTDETGSNTAFASYFSSMFWSNY